MLLFNIGKFLDAFESSCSVVLYRVTLKCFMKFARKHQRWSCWPRASTSLKKESILTAFQWVSRNLSQCCISYRYQSVYMKYNTGLKWLKYSVEHLRTPASVHGNSHKWEKTIDNCSWNLMFMNSRNLQEKHLCVEESNYWQNNHGWPQIKNETKTLTHNFYKHNIFSALSNHEYKS